MPKILLKWLINDPFHIEWIKENNKWGNCGAAETCLCRDAGPLFGLINGADTWDDAWEPQEAWDAWEPWDLRDAWSNEV